MKSLILLLMLILSFSIYSQDKVDVKDEAKLNNPADEWIAIIASDPEMRLIMIDMMIEKTEGNKEERMNLVNSIMKNPEMNKMMLEAKPGRMENESFSLEPRGMMKDSAGAKKTYNMEPLKRK